MWFSAVGKNTYKNIESIGFAYSHDGLTWQVHPTPVLERDTSSIWEDFYVSNPMVIKIDSTYFMFYGGLARMGFLFKENIDDKCFEVEKIIREFFGPSVLETTISENVALAEAPSHQKTIFEYAPKSSGAKDYRQLAKEFLKKFKN